MDSAVQAVYDAKSEEIGPGIYRFKAEIGQSCNAHLHTLKLGPASQLHIAVHCRWPTDDLAAALSSPLHTCVAWLYVQWMCIERWTGNV